MKSSVASTFFFFIIILSDIKSNLFPPINCIDLYTEMVQVYYCQTVKCLWTTLGWFWLIFPQSRSSSGHRGNAALLCCSPNHLCLVWILKKGNSSLAFWGLFSRQLIENVETVIGLNFYDLLHSEIEETLSEILRSPMLLSDILGCFSVTILQDLYYNSSNI